MTLFSWLIGCPIKWRKENILILNAVLFTILWEQQIVTKGVITFCSIINMHCFSQPPYYQKGDLILKFLEASQKRNVTGRTKMSRDDYWRADQRRYWWPCGCSWFLWWSMGQESFHLYNMKDFLNYYEMATRCCYRYRYIYHYYYYWIASDIPAPAA